MKAKRPATFTAVFLCALLPPLAPARQPGLDLSMRRAVYIAGGPATIDLKNDKYVGAGETITVNKNQAAGCQGNKCKFNLGIIAFKSGGPNTLKTYGQFTGQGLGIVGNSIVFNEGEKTKEHVLPVQLALGRNIVTFTIDPQNQASETDEKNNTISVTIVVQ